MMILLRRLTLLSLLLTALAGHAAILSPTVVPGNADSDKSSIWYSIFQFVNRAKGGGGFLGGGTLGEVVGKPRAVYILTNTDPESLLKGRPEAMPEQPLVTVTPEDVKSGKYILAPSNFQSDRQWRAKVLAEQRKRKTEKPDIIPDVKAVNPTIVLLVDRSKPTSFAAEDLEKLPLRPDHIKALAEATGDAAEDRVVLCCEEVLIGDYRTCFITVSAPNAEWLAEALRRLRVVHPPRQQEQFMMIQEQDYSFDLQRITLFAWPEDPDFVRNVGATLPAGKLAQRSSYTNRPEELKPCGQDVDYVPCSLAQAAERKDTMSQGNVAIVVSRNKRAEDDLLPPDAADGLRQMVPYEWWRAFCGLQKPDSLYCLAHQDKTYQLLFASPTQRHAPSAIEGCVLDGIHTERWVDFRGVQTLRVIPGLLRSDLQSADQAMAEICLSASQTLGAGLGGIQTTVEAPQNLTMVGGIDEAGLRQVGAGENAADTVLLPISITRFSQRHTPHWMQEVAARERLECGTKWNASKKRYDPVYKDMVTYRTYLQHDYTVDLAGSVSLLDHSGKKLWSATFTGLAHTSTREQESEDKRWEDETPPGLPQNPPSDSRVPAGLDVQAASSALTKADVLPSLLRDAILPSDGETWELEPPAEPYQGTVVAVNLDSDPKTITVELGPTFDRQKPVLWNVGVRGEDGKPVRVTDFAARTFSTAGNQATCISPYFDFDWSTLRPGMLVWLSETPDPTRPQQ